MSCPPGTVFNPLSLRCVKVTGRRAHELVRAGDIDPVEIRYRPQRNLFPQIGRRRTQRIPRPAAGAAPAPRPIEDLFAVPHAQKARLLGRHLFRSPTERGPPICAPGEELNPQTRRCIKVGGRTFKRVHRPAPPVLQVPAGPRPHVRFAPPGPAPSPSESPVRLPLGTAAVAPLGDRSAVLGWAAENCKNALDPLTHTVLVNADTAALQELIRLHDRTCTFATPLDRHVATDHKVGRIAAVPDEPTQPLTLDDFRALRDAMRRRNPEYKIPQRRHAPPPPEWQLIVTQDRRSGPDFLSVAYVDVTRGIRTADGIEYPPEAYRVDLGFLPARTPSGAQCSIQMIQDLLTRLARSNRLLAPVAGGWKPPAGLPFAKSYWQHAHRGDRFTRLCKDLAKLLG
jgi:hypothetical protein